MHHEHEVERLMMMEMQQQQSQMEMQQQSQMEMQQQSHMDMQQQSHHSHPGNQMNGGSFESEAAKRKHFLERNKIAAAKCRMKRKIFIQELERKAVQESERNIELQAHVNILRDEVMQLKNQLLMVKKCSCGGAVE